MPGRDRHSLRGLFVTALNEGIPDPPALWRRIAPLLSSDLVDKLDEHDIPENIPHPEQDLALFLIQKSLAETAQSLTDFGLPLPKLEWEHKPHSNPIIGAELAYDRADLAEQAAKMTRVLSAEQRNAFHTVLYAVEHRQPGAFFLTEGTGTGKTSFCKTLCAQLRSQGKIVVTAASTALAGSQLPGGRSSHTRFHIPIPTEASSSCNIPKVSDAAEMFQNTSLMIWDQVSMQRRYCFESVDRMLRDVAGKDVLFGGIPVVLSGDMQQMLPALPRGGRAGSVAASLKSSYIWGQLEYLPLKSRT